MVPAQPSLWLERQRRLAAGCSWGAAGAAQACDSQELPARLRTPSTHAPLCSSVRHSQAGGGHLPRRSCAWLRTVRSRMTEQRLQQTRCRTMFPTHSGIAACSPNPAQGGNLLRKLACSSSGIDTGTSSLDQPLERGPCPRGAVHESPVLIWLLSPRSWDAVTMGSHPKCWPHSCFHAIKCSQPKCPSALLCLQLSSTKDDEQMQPEGGSRVQ